MVLHTVRVHKLLLDLIKKFHIPLCIWAILQIEIEHRPVVQAPEQKCTGTYYIAKDLKYSQLCLFKNIVGITLITRNLMSRVTVRLN